VVWDVVTVSVAATHSRLFELDALARPMPARLARASERLGPMAIDDNSWLGLRAEQLPVVRDLARYLGDAATAAEADKPAWGRILLPPRTGKTVIAARLIGAAELTSVVVVPTRALVAQTVRELGTWLPGTPIGAWYGERRAAVDHGVNVTTYATLQTYGPNRLPPSIAGSALVIADEAHHSMTVARMNALRASFDPAAVRLAMTATPDFHEHRRLGQWFPDLVHEISLSEAVELGLLAPLRVWVVDVDADGAVVDIVGGDYDMETLGRVMSGAPFFRAVQAFRWSGVHRAMPCLVACSTRQQASDLTAWLVRHRPEGAPAPALLLGETPGREREQILADFESGAIDTIVQVGVLLEGWNAPRCKLLIDLAPSLSLVRATQKYFRVMTRWRDAEARIFVLVPQQLPAMPVLPMELFASYAGDYECGRLLGRRGGDVPTARPVDAGGPEVTGVQVRRRVRLTPRFETPRLRLADRRGLRAVLASCETFDARRPCTLWEFRGLFFQHSLFVGRGDFLMRWLKLPMTRGGYLALLARAHPEGTAWRFLVDAARRDGAHSDDPRATSDGTVETVDLADDQSESDDSGSDWDGADDATRVADYRLPSHVEVAALAPETPCTPEEEYLLEEHRANVRRLIHDIRPRRRLAVGLYFGIDDGVERTFDEVGIEMGISGGRAAQLVTTALRKLRFAISTEQHRERFVDELGADPRRRKERFEASMREQRAGTGDDTDLRADPRRSAALDDLFDRLFGTEFVRQADEPNATPRGGGRPESRRSPRCR